jgi:16S rRNA (adenine1518-N6/adenine1519-N6)-dimethyltransferase
VGQRLGQHFLIKGSVLERIAGAACPAEEDLVIEIGPGRGALTERLLKRAARVIAIEIDSSLADHLRRKFRSEARLEVLHRDVLETDLSRWGAAVIAGNLPYYITSPILEKALASPFRRAVFLVQKEVAQRLAAAPGSRDFGLLTARTAVFAEARLLFEVKPAAFHPPPEVDSAVVRLEPRPWPLPADEIPVFLDFLARCFRHKRKTLRNNLAPHYGRESIDTWPEAPLRAEQLPLEKFVEMFRRTR